MAKKKVFKITGMHCASCAISIDGELEDTDGIKKAETNYTRQQTEVEFEEDKVTEIKIVEIIQSVGYSAIPVNN